MIPPCEANGVAAAADQNQSADQDHLAFMFNFFDHLRAIAPVKT